MTSWEGYVPSVTLVWIGVYVSQRLLDFLSDVSTLTTLNKTDKQKILARVLCTGKGTAGMIRSDTQVLLYLWSLLPSEWTLTLFSLNVNRRPPHMCCLCPWTHILTVCWLKDKRVFLSQLELERPRGKVVTGQPMIMSSLWLEKLKDDYWLTVTHIVLLPI